MGRSCALTRRVRSLATVIASVVSFIAVKWLLRYVQTHTFNAFGWYRILVGAAIFVALGAGLK